MKLRSGSRCLVSGVGTQMMIASASPSRAKSAVAANRPLSRTRGDAGRADVPQIGAAGIEDVDLGLVDVEAERRKAALGGGAQQRQPDIAEADHADRGGAVAKAARRASISTGSVGPRA